MAGLTIRCFTLLLIVIFAMWTTSLFESCDARRGGHWRHRAVSASLSSKKKTKSHNGHSNNNHHHRGSKSKPKPKAKSPPKEAPEDPPVDDVPPQTGGSATYNVLDFGAIGDGSTDDTKVSKDNDSTKSLVNKTNKILDESNIARARNGFSYGSWVLISNNNCTEEYYNTRTLVVTANCKTTLPKRCYGVIQAFKDTWAAVCKEAASTMVVPSEYVFLVGPISFAGPNCQHNIVFQLDGNIIAPTNSEAWGKGLLQWLEFTKLIGITIRGNGVIDGSGSVWWQSTPYDDLVDSEEKLIVPLNKTIIHHPVPISTELSVKMPRIKPTALRFYGSFNVTVTGITIQNSPQCHLKFDNCMGVSVSLITVNSPGDSPNTDGIHLQNSRQVLIHSVNLACGDDCISIQTGCSNVYVHNVNCGPGHGISIGSLGKDNTKACVSNITVRDVIMQNTMNGVRIKTWQGGSGSVQGVLFSNIQVSEVQLPIVIDQYYCDHSTCNNQSTAVALSGITYERIRGTYTVKPVHFACSDNLPCVDVSLTSIQLKPVQERYHMYDPFCWQAFGQLNTPTLPPIDCLQLGKPSRNRIQSDQNIC